jgi:hypothetical protein
VCGGLQKKIRLKRAANYVVRGAGGCFLEEYESGEREKDLFSCVSKGGVGGGGRLASEVGLSD